MSKRPPKICLRCGHPVSYMHGDWCDIILYKPDDPGFHDPESKDDPDEYPLLCCNGECVYEPSELNKPLAKIAGIKIMAMQSGEISIIITNPNK